MRDAPRRLCTQSRGISKQDRVGHDPTTHLRATGEPSTTSGRGDSREIQAHPGHAILVLHGELDLATQSQLRDVAMAQLSVSGLATLGLDLADIRFLDSSGISVLVELRSQAQERGIALEILAVSRRAARVLTIVGLTESFGIPPDPDAVPA
jgi:anti-sigma B factor antagonist